MNHLDEGTIHAWLDGALDPERAREVDAHVRECPTCAAAVAEARGLVAAASRILSALDDVPNVIPASTKRPAEPKRMWRAAPWVTGIAAVLLAAIVLRTTRDAPNLAEQTANMDAATRTARLALDSMAARQTEAAPSETPIRLPAPARLAASGSGSPSKGGVAVAASMARERAADVAVSAPSAAVAVGALPIGVARGAVGESAPAAIAGAIDSARVRRAEDEETRRRVRLAPPPTLQDVIATNVAERRLLLDSLSPADLAGCYEIRRGEKQDVAATMEAVSARKATRAAAAMPSAAAAPPVERFVSDNTLLVVRLDTLRGRPGWIVRSAISDSAVGWWRRIARDSARVDLLTAGSVTFTPAQRVPCPGDKR